MLEPSCDGMMLMGPPRYPGGWEVLMIVPIEHGGTSIVVDVWEMFDGPRLPYGPGDGVYGP